MSTEPETKRDEIARTLQEAFKTVSLSPDSGEMEAILEALCSIQTPTYEIPKLETKFNLTRFDDTKAWKGGAVNIKPGNITLNMHKLVTTVASGVLTIGGAVTAPWSIPFAALVLWDSIYSGIQCKLCEHDAVVLWVMWKLKDENNNVANEAVLPEANKELIREGRSEMTKPQFTDATDNLRAISCIEPARQLPDHWWLREWCRVKYT